MEFGDLPTEIKQAILIWCVHSRGIKRGLRLRLVSRSWDELTTRAMFHSGLFGQNEASAWQSPLWPQYLVYKAMGSKNALPPQLQTARSVAQRLARAESALNPREALQETLLRILSVSHDIHPVHLKYCADNNATLEGDENDIFQQTLLAAAICIGDVGTVKECLPRLGHCKYMVCQDGKHSGLKLLLGYPIDLAGYTGHAEISALLLQFLGTSKHIALAKDSLVRYAARSGDMDTLLLGLEGARTDEHDPTIVYALGSTTHVDMFILLLQICKDHLIDDIRMELHPEPKSILPKYLRGRFVGAAARGETEVVRYMLEQGLASRTHEWDKEDYYEYYNPLTVSAAGGHQQIFELLLLAGFERGLRSLEAAAKCGNIRILRKLLENWKWSQDQLRNALVQGVQREHDDVVAMILSLTPVADLVKADITSAAQDGLESIRLALQSAAIPISPN